MKDTTILDKTSTVIIMTACVLLCIVTLYPFIYVLAYALSDSMTAMVTQITLFPVNFTFDNFLFVLDNPAIGRAFFISVARTALGIAYALIITGLAAYAISKEKLVGKRAITIFLIIPMYVSGGLIPYYVLIHQIGLFNNFLVYILPHGFWAFNMLIMRTYFQTIPSSLEEQAQIDGAGPLTIFFRIIVPLSMPIVATISIFVGVWHWNSWFDGMLFMTKRELIPMQTLMQRLLVENFTTDIFARISQTASVASPESVKMAMIIVTTVPVICIYPFFQKYFIKGVMIGAVKA